MSTPDLNREIAGPGCSEIRRLAQRSEIDALKVEVERLRAGLQWYANPAIYKPHPHGLAFDDRDLSFHARAVLGEQYSPILGSSAVDAAAALPASGAAAAKGGAA